MGADHRRGPTDRADRSPRELQQNGVRAEIEGDRRGVDVTIGMLGDAVRVTSFRLLD
ncbi:MAG: hypothetical protein M5U28_01530 [Sandaracinaceae bacterium]|nr:hypothetical protein [Sandaracinaceae bacterium]